MEQSKTRSLALVKAMVVILALAVAFSVALAPSVGHATTLKSVKYQNYTSSTSSINQKAASVKTGAFKLTFKKGKGYLKFKAPKTKKYRFTFSGVKGTSCAYVEVLLRNKTNPKYSFMEKVSTKGGKSETLWLSGNNATFSGKNVLTRPLSARSGTIKLTKGTWIYFFFSAGNNKATALLSVK